MRHQTTVHRSLSVPGSTRTYFATCTCGWQSGLRVSSSAAQDEAERHEEERNVGFRAKEVKR